MIEFEDRTKSKYVAAQEAALEMLKRHGITDRQKALDVARSKQEIAPELYTAFITAATPDESYIYGEHLNYLVRRNDIPAEEVYKMIELLRELNEMPQPYGGIRFYTQEEYTGVETLTDPVIGAELETAGLLVTNPSIPAEIIDELVAADKEGYNYVDYVTIPNLSGKSVSVIVKSICGEDYNPTVYVHFNGWTFLKMADRLLLTENLTEEDFNILFNKVIDIGIKAGGDRRSLYIQVNITDTLDKVNSDDYIHKAYVTDNVRSRILMFSVLKET